MPTRDPKAILEKLGQTTLKIDSTFLRRTGFIANQTLLKLGDYHLNCVPATIGLEAARFLAVLTPSEISLFSRYKEGTQTLILTFDNPDSKDIARFPLRVNLLAIEPIPNRNNVCFLVLKLKSLPTELVLFLGAYLEGLEERLAAWETLAGESLPYAIEVALSAGLGYGAVLVVGDKNQSVEIVEYQTKSIGLRPAEGQVLPAAETAALRLMYQGRPLNLEGALKEGGAFLPEFNSDWLSFVEESLFQQRLKGRSHPGKTP